MSGTVNTNPPNSLDPVLGSLELDAPKLWVDVCYSRQTVTRPSGWLIQMLSIEESLEGDVVNVVQVALSKLKPGLEKGGSRVLAARDLHLGLRVGVTRATPPL